MRRQQKAMRASAKRRYMMIGSLAAAALVIVAACLLVVIVGRNDDGGTSNDRTGDDDQRQYIHGLDMVRLGGRDMLVFAANGYPPQPAGDDEWRHDIYYSYIDTDDPQGSFRPQPLVARRLAQEPASSAVNADGNLLVTAEDAEYSDDLDQTYGLWNHDLRPLLAYGAKSLPPQGGHSGHVAASGRDFLVSFSDGWVDGGGVDNLGTGDDVYGRIVHADGSSGSLVRTAVGDDDRDWWPLVAGSDTNWLQVWQRYGAAGAGGGSVQGAIVNRDGSVVRRLTIFDNDLYYYHDVRYVPALGMYLVVGSQNKSKDAGVAVLVDKTGTIVATKTGLPNTVREARTVVSDDGRTAVYAVPKSKAAVLDLSTTSIALRTVVATDGDWGSTGSDGVFTASDRLLMATGTPQGIRFIAVRL